MFSDVMRPGDKIYVYRYEVVHIDGSQQNLPRSFADGFGLGELNLWQYIEDRDVGQLRKIFQSYIKRVADARVDKIRITKLSVDWPSLQNNYALVESKEIIFEFSAKELYE